MGRHRDGRAVSSTPRRRSGLRTLFLLLGLALLAVFAWAALDLSAQVRLHHRLAGDGTVVTADVQQVRLSRYDGRGSTGRRVAVSDPDDADAVAVHLRFDAGGRSIATTVDMRLSLRRHDHVQPYRDALGGHLRVRYLPDDPSQVRPEAEFTDPDANPHGFAW